MSATARSDIDSGIDAPALCSGPPVALAIVLGRIAGIAVDDAFVYWTNPLQAYHSPPVSGDVYRVERVPIEGGSVQTLATMDGDTSGLVLSQGALFWTTPNNTVLKLPVSGGTPTTLVQGQAGTVNFSPPIAADAAFVYWANEASDALERVPIGGGASSTLATGISWASDVPSQMMVDDTHIYWAWSDVEVMLKGGGSVTTLEQLEAPFAAFGGDVYSRAYGGLGASSITGGATVTLASIAGGFPNGIAADASNVYWTAGGVWKVPRSGGATTTVSVDGTGTGAQLVSTDAKYVYWSNVLSKNESSIVRACK